jgi:selenocysteine lyase/cysteine desulfurase
MSTRSGFIKQSIATIAGLSLAKFSLAEPNPDTTVVELANAERLFMLDKDVVFLNNGTMGPSPKPVVDALMEGLAEVTHKAQYGRRKQEAIDSLASYLGVSNETIGITHSTTESINMMAMGLSLKAGDEVILTEHEHVGNAAPWLYRAMNDKLIIKTFKLANTAEQTIANLRKVVTGKTKVLALPHITCTTGHRLPIKEICTWATKKNITTCIDGAHGAGMLNLNLSDLGCDFYAGCCHKWLLAAQGTAYLYVAAKASAKIKQRFLGADGMKDFDTKNGTGHLVMRPVSGKGFMLGTQSGALLNSITAAVQLHQNFGKLEVEKKVLELSDYFYERLADLGKLIAILSPTERASRSAMISFRLQSSETKKLQESLHAQGIITRFVAESGLDCIRVSTHIYNSKAHVDQLIVAMQSFY